jgi:hypothetical protein
MKKIVYKNSEGGITIDTPAIGCIYNVNGELILENITEDEALERAKENSRARGIHNFFVIDEESVPTDRSERMNWDIDETGKIFIRRKP